MDGYADYMTSMVQSMTQEGRAEANGCGEHGHAYDSDNECHYCYHVKGQDES